MTDQTTPNNTGNANSERLAEILQRLNMTQIRFCVARLETKTDKQAALDIQITDNVVKGWNDDGAKALVDEAVKLMAFDGVITALELRRRSLAKAMAVKAAGLDSESEKIQQDAATELIEWELGKATQRAELSGPDGTAIPIDIFDRAVKKVYGG
ncbi:hypothetical protein CCP3SC15_3870003 [Gammaproteobacteria bacterium]